MEEMNPTRATAEEEEYFSRLSEEDPFPVDFLLDKNPNKRYNKTMNETTTFTVSLNAEEFAMIEKFRAEKAKKSWGSVLRQINRIITVSFGNTLETFDVDSNPDFLEHSESNRARIEDCLTSLGFKVKAYGRSWMQISRI